MKQLSTLLFLVISSSALLAQTFSGNWQGAIAAVQNPQQEFPSSMSLRVAGNQLTGSVTAKVPTGTETYRVTAQIQGTEAAGTVTDLAAGTSMNLEMVLKDGKLIIAFGLNHVASVMGAFVPQGGEGKATAPQPRNPTAAEQAVPNPKADGLPRNARLVGTWAHTSNYGSSGFYSSTRTLLVFYPDGRLGSGGGQAHASYEGVNGSSNVNTGANAVNVVPGAVWYTKGDKIWVHATQQKVPDEAWGRFVMTSDGRAMHIFRGNSRTLYERTN
ncbi:hypothetical protein [Fibrella aquatica]|uniref:hypothetical protein n=1 Tax=Fibrella aquatica TaxID=3242487 RepID=UPI00351FF68B